jgi:pantoate--beta-alanine ligase
MFTGAGVNEAFHGTPESENMIQIINDPREMQARADAQRVAGKRIAVVPTMGALHEGHFSLIRLARTQADLVITTIFVNPTQFGKGEDFERYPRDLGRDTSLCAGAGTDIVFVPEISTMYTEGYRTFVTVEGISEVLEGAARPGHFRGVATVVTKLLGITKPHLAVFGQKDAQQVVILKRLVLDLNLDVTIVVGPIVREKDGLAMSSRNVYLSPEQRAEAPILYRALQLGMTMIRKGERRGPTVSHAMRALITGGSSGIVEYVSIADSSSLDEKQLLGTGEELLLSLAVQFGSTRLIDNLMLIV